MKIKGHNDGLKRASRPVLPIKHKATLRVKKKSVLSLLQEKSWDCKFYTKFTVPLATLPWYKVTLVSQIIQIRIIKIWSNLNKYRAQRILF